MRRGELPHECLDREWLTRHRMIESAPKRLTVSTVRGRRVFAWPFTWRRIMLLHEFIATNSDELLARCEAKVAKRPAPHPSVAQKHGIPQFLKQLGKALREEKSSSTAEIHKTSGPSSNGTVGARSEIAQTAAKHGDELLEQGFTVDQVVHDYGDLCQSITELAIEKNAPISNEDFHTLNLCLDNAIAGAVTEYGCHGDQVAFDEGTAVTKDRLGGIHELGKMLGSVTLAFAAIKDGKAGLNGATAAVVDRSLIAMRELMDQLLAEGVDQRTDGKGKATA
jgi:hypothetical protein